MTVAVSSILEGLASAGKAFDVDEAGSREALIEHSRALIGALEIPSEFVQRSFWAEVSPMYPEDQGTMHNVACSR